MKKFKLFILSLLPLLAGAQMAMADIKGAPYIPEIDCRFNALEQGQTLASGCSGFPIGSADGHYVKQVAKATYDFSKKGGAVGSIPLGVTIPANAIETRSYLYSITQPTTSASGTLAFYCASSTNPDLKQATAAASYPAAGSSADGTQSGVASNFSVVGTSACTINAKIATGALTAGKVVLYVEYVVHQ